MTGKQITVISILTVLALVSFAIFVILYTQPSTPLNISIFSTPTASPTISPTQSPENTPDSSITTQNSQIKVYFINYQKSGVNDCKTVYSLNRTIPKTQAVGKASIEELLKGPVASEKQQGYETLIPQGVVLQSIDITNGIAKVDFNNTLNSAAGSCRVTGINSQITQTLLQFPTVKQVVISVNGRTDDVLQP